MKTTESYNATTKLCSSYAWDTALKFIQNKVLNYGSSSNQGNYYDTAFSYTDITGMAQTKTSSSNVLVPTGETTPICGIYDMGGNDWEWTTEICNYDVNAQCVSRGGTCYNHDPSTTPAGARTYAPTNYSNNDMSFRVTLYM